MASVDKAIINKLINCEIIGVNDNLEKKIVKRYDWLLAELFSKLEFVNQIPLLKDKAYALSDIYSFALWMSDDILSSYVDDYNSERFISRGLRGVANTCFIKKTDLQKLYYDRTHCFERVFYSCLDDTRFTKIKAATASMVEFDLSNQSYYPYQKQSIGRPFAEIKKIVDDVYRTLLDCTINCISNKGIYPGIPNLKPVQLKNETARKKGKNEKDLTKFLDNQLDIVVDSFKTGLADRILTNINDEEQIKTAIKEALALMYETLQDNAIRNKKQFQYMDKDDVLSRMTGAFKEYGFNKAAYSEVKDYCIARSYFYKRIYISEPYVTEDPLLNLSVDPSLRRGKAYGLVFLFPNIAYSPDFLIEPPYYSLPEEDLIRISTFVSDLAEFFHKVEEDLIQYDRLVIMKKEGVPAIEIIGRINKQILNERRFCRTCGEKIPQGGLFCPKCGTKVIR